MTLATTLLRPIRENPRLRLGLWLILGVLGLYAVLDLRDRVAAQEDGYRRAAQELAILRASATQQAWPERAEAAQLLKAELEGRLGQAATEGLAAANLEDRLNSQLREVGAEGAKVEVSATDRQSDVNMPDDLWVLKARVRFRFVPGALVRLLQKLAETKRLIAIDTLEIRTSPVPSVELNLTAFFQASG